MSNQPKLNLGLAEVSFVVLDLHKSLEFYKKLGFEVVEGVLDENWQVVAQNGFRIGLYQGHINKNLITFFHKDMGAKIKQIEDMGIELDTEVVNEDDGTIGVTIMDPDGNKIYLNSCEPE